LVGLAGDGGAGAADRIGGAHGEPGGAAVAAPAAVVHQGVGDVVEVGVLDGVDGSLGDVGGDVHLVVAGVHVVVDVVDGVRVDAPVVGAGGDGVGAGGVVG